MQLEKKDGIPNWTRRQYSNGVSTWICFAVSYGPTGSHLIYDYLFGRLKDAKEFIKDIPAGCHYRIRTLESVNDLSPCNVNSETFGVASVDDKENN